MPRRPSFPALYACFATLGFCTASIFVRYPAFQRDFALDNGQWGGLLFALGLGGVCAYPVQHWALLRWSSRQVFLGGGVLFAVLLAVLPHASGVLLLDGLAWALGLCINVVNVAAQQQVLALQALTGLQRMGRLHAMYYVGTALAALLALLTVRLHLALAADLALAAALVLGVLAVGGRWLVATPVRAASVAPAAAAAAAAAPLMPTLVCLGLVGSACEGALAGWATLYLTRGLAVPVGLAGTGVAAFSVAMMLGRLLSDRLLPWLGGRRLLVAGSVAGALALQAALLQPGLPLTLAALAVAGLGLAGLFPVVFDQAGRHPGNGIARVAAFGAAGSLLSPLLLGQVSSHAPLFAVLALIILGLLGCAVLARHLPGPAPR